MCVVVPARINRAVPYLSLQKPLDLTGTAMTSQSQGIHQLLQAEKRAKDKLEEAKKRECPCCVAVRDSITQRTGWWVGSGESLGPSSMLRSNPGFESLSARLRPVLASPCAVGTQASNAGPSEGL